MTLIHTHNPEARLAYLKAFAKRRKQQAKLREQIEHDRQRAAAHVYQLRPGTNPARIMEAVAQLPEPFTLAQLVWACWCLDPVMFGMQCGDMKLPGIVRSFPDSNKVVACLSGKKRGLIARGLLKKEGARYWRTTG